MSRYEVMRPNEGGLLIHICCRDTLVEALRRAQEVANKRGEVLVVYHGEEWVQAVEPEEEAPKPCSSAGCVRPATEEAYGEPYCRACWRTVTA